MKSLPRIPPQHQALGGASHSRRGPPCQHKAGVLGAGAGVGLTLRERKPAIGSSSSPLHLAFLSLAASRTVCSPAARAPSFPASMWWYDMPVLSVMSKHVSTVTMPPSTAISPYRIKSHHLYILTYTRHALRTREGEVPPVYFVCTCVVGKANYPTRRHRVKAVENYIF